MTPRVTMPGGGTPSAPEPVLPEASGMVPEEATSRLRDADPVLAGLIGRIGPLTYPVEPDLWRGIVGAIVGQQLSVAAAATIRARVAALGDAGFPGPDEVLATSDEVLRGCGLSRPKIGYLRDLAVRWRDELLPVRQLPVLADEEVIERLVEVRGIGRWTAEMLLIFSLRRPDVLAVDDLGIRNAVQRAYGLPDRPGAAELTALGEPWRPFRSFASLYLWRSLRV